MNTARILSGSIFGTHVISIADTAAEGACIGDVVRFLIDGKEVGRARVVEDELFQRLSRGLTLVQKDKLEPFNY